MPGPHAETAGGTVATAGTADTANAAATDTGSCAGAGGAAPSPARPEAAVELRGVWVRRAGLTVLEDVSAAIPAGSFTGLVGPNGGGKTTLVKLLLGLFQPDAGTVRVLGQKPFGNRSLRRHIGYLPQVPRLDPGFPVSVRDVVELGCLGRGGVRTARLTGSSRRKADAPSIEPGTSPRQAADWAMNLVGIAEIAPRPIGQLSGGQRQMALLARALAARPRLLLLDEPLTGLDRERRAGFYPLVRRLQRAHGMTVLAVCHDLHALAAEVDALLCLDRTVHAHAAPAHIPRLADWAAGRQRCVVDALLGGGRGAGGGCSGWSGAGERAGDGDDMG